MSSRFNRIAKKVQAKADAADAADAFAAKVQAMVEREVDEQVGIIKRLNDRLKAENAELRAEINRIRGVRPEEFGRT